MMSLHQRLADLDVAPRTQGIDTYVLTENAAHRALLARLEFHDVPHRQLWRLEAQGALEMYSPNLFLVQAGNAFDEWLGDVFDTVPMTVVQTRLSFDALWRHLRHFCKFQESGQRYLRLGAPCALRLYVASIAHSPTRVGRLFDDGRIQELFFHDAGAALSRRVRPLFEPPTADMEDHDYLVWADVTASDSV
ncbi:DUF4123 domain-containing protein [Achromobacter spanius]|uniref:DUF4123 domain-containing protein n=1 Tax=Achromobacter spanius TaxID=217203 RepID=UPI00320A2FD6